MSTQSSKGVELIVEDGASLTFDSVPIPIGGVILWFGDNYIPSGWLKCDGSSFNPRTYQQLYKILGTEKLPDLKYRSVICKGTSKDINNAPTFTCRKPNDVEILKQGENTTILKTENIPDHNHDFSIPGWVPYDLNEANDSSSFRGEIWEYEKSPFWKFSETGNNLPHNNVPPVIAINYIIRAE